MLNSKSTEIIVPAAEQAAKIRRLIENFDADAAVTRLNYRTIFAKGQIITKESLRLTPIGTLVDLGEGMQCFRLPDSESDTLNFWNIWQPDVVMALHSHDCYEDIYVFSGGLTSRSCVYGAGSNIKYAPFVSHLVGSTNQETTFLVQFR